MRWGSSHVKGERELMYVCTCISVSVELQFPSLASKRLTMFFSFSSLIKLDCNASELFGYRNMLHMKHWTLPSKTLLGYCRSWGFEKDCCPCWIWIKTTLVNINSGNVSIIINLVSEFLITILG
jgi:hypothetical protein